MLIIEVSVYEDNSLWSSLILFVVVNLSILWIDPIDSLSDYDIWLFFLKSFKN